MPDPNERQPSRPVGVLDSGIGGLSVLLHLRQELPAENFLYFADQVHIPYGPRPRVQVQHFAVEIARFLLTNQAKLIVVACNTASAAALEHLRQIYTDVPIIGMEPAVKPAATNTRTGKVGVLATAGTFNSHRYADLMVRFASGVEVLEDPCTGLVERIENGELNTPETRAIIERAVDPMLSAGVDTLVLGCTHYPFILPLLQEIVGDVVEVIDPAPAVARHTKTVLQNNQLETADTGRGTIQCFTTGDVEAFAALTERLMVNRCATQKACWREDMLTIDC